MNDETSKWLMDGYATPEPRVRTDQAKEETRVEGTGNASKSWRGTIGERYKIRDRIAETGASYVYEAWDEFRQLRVAIKELRLPKADAEELADLISRFEESAEITRHPRIVEVKKFLEIDGRYYIVMEFMDAGSLDDRIKRIEQQPLTLGEVKTVMNDLFAALEHSHQSKIIHRDVKPANILLSSTAGWKLTDFGIARIMSSTRTQDGTFLGTPAYSSPEQVKGLLVDERTDIYSCGVVLYELLAGQRPFRGGEDTVKRKIVYQEPAPPSTLGKLSLPALDKVVARAMAKDRDQRYGTIAALREAMDAALRLPAIKVSPPRQFDQGVGHGAVIGPRDRLNPLPDARRKPRRGRWIIAMLAGLAALGVAGYGTWRALPILLPPVPAPQPMPSAKPSQEVLTPAPMPAPAQPKAEPAPARPFDYAPPPAPSYTPPPAEPTPAQPSDYASLPAPSYTPPPAEPTPARPIDHSPPPMPSYAPPPVKPAPTRPADLAPPSTPSYAPPSVKAPPARPGDLALLPNLKLAPAFPEKPSDDRVLKLPAPQASGLEVGLLCMPVTTEQVKYLNIPDTDVSLVQVQGATNGLAADRAGIRSGDILQKTGDLSTRSDFVSQCLVTPTGGRAVVKVWRNHAWQQLTIRVN